MFNIPFLNYLKISNVLGGWIFKLKYEKSIKSTLKFSFNNEMKYENLKLGSQSEHYHFWLNGIWKLILYVIQYRKYLIMLFSIIWKVIYFNGLDIQTGLQSQPEKLAIGISIKGNLAIFSITKMMSANFCYLAIIAK